MFKRFGFVSIVLFFGLFFLALFFKYHYEVISYPYQVEYREGAHYLVSVALSKGHFPFTLANQPDLSYMYGIVYPLISSFFIQLFGDNISILRVISALSILISTLYFVRYNLKLKVRSSQVFLSCILFYGINLFLCIPSARPDALGYLFFILSVFIPFQYSFSKKSLLISLIFALFAFYTKPYFLLSFLIVGSYLFLFESIIRGIKYLGTYIFTLLASMVLMERFLDVYFLGTLGIQFSESVYDFNHMLTQTSFFFKDLFLYLSIVFFTYLIVRLFRNRFLLASTIDTSPFWFDTFLNLRDFKKPFITNKFKLHFNLYVFIVSFILLTFKLGGHTGQFGVYYIQFLLFPFLAYLNTIFNHQEFKKVVFIHLLFLITLYQFTNLLPVNKIQDLNKAQNFFNRIQPNEDVLASPAVASFLINKNKKVYLSGLTEYSGIINNLKNNNRLLPVFAKLKDKLFLNKINIIEKKVSENKLYVAQKIKDRKFAYIITDTSIYDDWLINKQKLHENYMMKDSFELNMAPSYTKCFLYIYVPKSIKKNQRASF